MQLRPPAVDEAPADLAAALAQRATTLGQRPAVTVLDGRGRAEQGFVTLAQWAAKGAHLLLTDAVVQPGDPVLVDVPPGWQLAAVCAAVWWVGGAVVTDPAAVPDGVVAGVVHESRDDPGGVRLLFVVGDAADGGTTGVEGGAAAVATGSWAEEVQVFPDQPPPTAARGDLVALHGREGPVTHQQLVNALRGGAGDRPGTLGVALDTWRGELDDAVRQVAARPLATGRTTLVLGRGLSPADAEADRVAVWHGDHRDRV